MAKWNCELTAAAQEELKKAGVSDEVLNAAFHQLLNMPRSKERFEIEARDGLELQGVKLSMLKNYRDHVLTIMTQDQGFMLELAHAQEEELKE